MKADDPRAKWHPIDQAALSHIQSCSSSTGLHEITTTALPSQIQKMEGVVSYYVSTYSAPITLRDGITQLGGEMAVLRTHDSMVKAYNYVFASSNDGRVYFNGPHYDFAEHHFASSAPVQPEALFGHIDFTNKQKP